MAKKMLALALAAALCCALFAVPASAVIPPPGAEETAAPYRARIAGYSRRGERVTL